MINKELWKKRLNLALYNLQLETNKAKIKIIEKKIKTYNVKLKEPSLKEPSSKELSNRKNYNCLNKYNYNNDEIFIMLKNSIIKFYENGPRSSTKLNILHSFINCIVAYKLKELNSEIYKDISIYSHPIKEIKVNGLLYNKNVDITIKYKSHNIGIISVKFIMSNYSQNNINYLETMIGESVNLKAVKSKRIFWHPIFIFNKIPYYDNKNNIKKNENIKFDKYNKLNNYIIKNKDKHTLLPDFISITILNNNIDLIHPNNIKDIDINKYINDLINKEEPIIEIDNNYNFITNLHNFCIKVLENIIEKYINKKHFDSFTIS